MAGSFPTGAAVALTASYQRGNYPVRFRVSEVQSTSELESYLGPWEDLAEESIETNVFYEPWMIIPALEAFHQQHDISLLFVYAEMSSGEELLCGFFPVEHRKRYQGFPTDNFRMFRYYYSSLCTPLIRTGFERETLEIFFRWLMPKVSRGATFSFSLFGANGPFHLELSHQLARYSGLVLDKQQFGRAFLSADGDATNYFSTTFSGKHRKEFRRLERRLADCGAVQYQTFSEGDDINEWCERFLELEASGWKGKARSAFAAQASSAQFFRAIVHGAHARKKLHMHALSAGETVVAQFVAFESGSGRFAFRVAYHEQFAAVSPGTLLLLADIKELFGNPKVSWIDSCADKGHFMANRIWQQKRAIANISIMRTDSWCARYIRAMRTIERLRAKRSH